jgi:hypothetical protein
MRDVEAVRALAKPLVDECMKKAPTVSRKTSVPVWIEVNHKQVTDEIEAKINRRITSEEDDVIRGLLNADAVSAAFENNDSQRSNNRSSREPTQPVRGVLSVKIRGALGLSSWDKCPCHFDPRTAMFVIDAAAGPKSSKVSGVERWPDRGGKKQNRFNLFIHKQQGQMVELFADTAEELKEWLDAMEGTITGDVIARITWHEVLGDCDLNGTTVEKRQDSTTEAWDTGVSSVEVLGRSSTARQGEWAPSVASADSVVDPYIALL